MKIFLEWKKILLLWKKQSENEYENDIIVAHKF